MRAVYVLIVTLILTSVCVESQSPVFVVDPVSVVAVHGTTVEFSCTASDVTQLFYLVNNEPASLSAVQDKGFSEVNLEILSDTLRRRNLTVIVSSLYNNTEIKCQATGNSMLVNSDTAILSVQGSLTSIGDLSSSFIDSSTIHISWSSPYTLPGTAITGYNISVTSNGTTTNYFRSDSYYVLQLRNITDSPCNEINITVSGYNGLNGETNSISVPPSKPVVPVSVVILKNLQITVEINVTSICIDERPTTVNITLFRDDTVVYRTDVMFSDTPLTEILATNLTYTTEEDMNYTIMVSFSIFDGDFDVIGREPFDTFGVGSVNLTDTDDDSVFCRCIFHLFSTDTGCTIKLVLSEVIWYSRNFSRSGSTATGSISGVVTGLYLVHVFDQGNPTVVLTSEIMVIGEPATTTTTTSVTSSMATSTSTVPVVPPVTPSISPNAARDSQTTTLYIAIAVTIGAVIIILLAVVLILAACIVWWKNYHNDSKGNQLDAFLASSDFDGTSPTTSSPPQVETQDITDLYSKPNKKPVTVEPVMYADLSEIKKKHRPSPSKPADSRVVYSNLLIKGQPPPPPYEPVELKRVSNIQASVTVIPVGTNVDESEFNNEIVELRFPHMDNYQEAVKSRATSDYPPPPEGRAPSPPNEGDDQPPPIPDRHLPDVVQNNQRPADKEEGFTDESMHPELGELISGKDDIQHGGHFMNTPTATYL